jgi:HupE / UreJ protein
MTGSRARSSLAALAALPWACYAHAHVASNGFLVGKVTGQDIAGSVELAVRDVELAVGVDADGDGKVTWGELKAAQPRVVRYVRDHLALSAQNDACDLSFQEIQVNDRVDGNYAWLPFTARCRIAVRELQIHYTMMHGFDPSHRGLLTLIAGDVTQTGVLGGSTPHATFSVFAPSRWRSLTRVRPALVGIFKVVTAFTLAHSLTLTLAALDIVRLPNRLTESVIAASIIIAALNNIVPIVTENRARIAFAFGLLHGFGFASVLADMGLPRSTRLTSLLSFNLGIETGQMAVVILVIPIIYGMRSGVFYRRAVMPWGSAAIAALALVWFVQRALFPTG